MSSSHQTTASTWLPPPPSLTHSHYVLTPRSYRLVRGSVNLGNGNSGRKFVAVDPKRINFPLPPLQTVSSWELPPARGSGTHLHSNAAFIELALSSPGMPLIKLELCNIVPVASATDARPLNQGVFGLETVVDGALTVQLGGAYRRLPNGELAPFDAAALAQLVREGNAACRRALHTAKFVTDVLETVTTTLDSSIVLNTSTWYQTGAPKSEQVAKDVKQRKALLEVCLACIEQGCSDCVKGIDGRCNGCRLKGCSCDYLKEVCAVELACGQQGGAQ